MTSRQIFLRLAEIAPSIAFSQFREEDDSIPWDGDSPDPAEEGYRAYTVTVRAVAIEDGQQKEGNAYLGSCYFKDEEPIDDNGGYLPQMIEEAAADLLDDINDNPGNAAIVAQIEAAIGFINEEMSNRYAEQSAMKGALQP